MLSLIYRLLLNFKRHELKAEMLDTFEQSRAEARTRGWREYFSFGVREIFGLFGLQASPRPRRWTAVAGWTVAGALAGVAATYVIPARYSSEAAIQVTPNIISPRLVPNEDSPDVSRVIQTLLPVVLSRTRLTTIINDFGLYPHLRARTPIEDVLVQMRHAIRIEPRGANVLEIRFTYWDSPSKESDRLLAQKVAQQLVAGFIDENVRQRHTQAFDTAVYLKLRSEVVATEWDGLTAQLRALPDGAPRQERLQLDRDLARQEYESLRRKLSDAQVMLDLENRKQGITLLLLEPASLHLNPDTTPVWIVLTGLGAGLFVGIVVALWRTARGMSAESVPAEAEGR
jgi:uncharacterized protein involved in exopolysaccharide biosynthesis